MPVDLTHIARLTKAIDSACDPAVHFGAKLTSARVTASALSPVAHNPQEYERKLGAFAVERGRKHGIGAAFKAYVVHDPSIQIDVGLIRAAADIDTDLMVMASHNRKLVHAIRPSRSRA